MKIVDIIIVRYNNPEFEERCIECVRQSTYYPHFLTIHDNYPENKNIGKLWNELINKSRGSYICLLNTDAFVTPFWLSKLMEVFKREVKVGAVSPSTNRSKNRQSALQRIPLDYEIEDFEGYESLSGFCLLFPKTIWRAVGGFPENFGFYGQEVVFMDKILDRKHRLIWRKDVFVFHWGSATVQKEEEEGNFNELEERRKARKLFETERNEN
jgi:GT2 family glycosyltransferase